LVYKSSYLKHKCPLFPERRIFNVKPGGTYSKLQALKGGPCQSKRGYVG